MSPLLASAPAIISGALALLAWCAVFAAAVAGPDPEREETHGGPCDSAG